MNFLTSLNRFRGHAVWTGSLGRESVIIDAGAHCGQFSETIHGRFGCRCIMIEANPNLAEKIEATPGGNVVHAALTSTDGITQFVVRSNPESGSIVDRPTDNGISFESIETISLGSLFQRHDLKEVDLLKLDIEGAEFELFAKTPDHILKTIKQITVEFHDFFPEYQGSGLFQSTRTRLEKLGFVCCIMSFRTHGDVIFLNRNLVDLSTLQMKTLRFLGRWILKIKKS